MPSTSGQFIAPMGLGVLAVTAAAWYVTWEESDPFMSFMMMPFTMLAPGELAAFFALMTAMMAAMMLPAALPMITAYRLLLGRKAVTGGTSAAKRMAAFMAPYLLLWGGFGVLSLSGLVVLGLMGPMSGILGFSPAVVLVGAGVYQFTRAKEACLQQCRSPFSFMLTHWRDGNLGAVRMGISHASYCLGCCWLFMIALFVIGAMSLVWMGFIAIMIFVEKVGLKKALLSRVLGVLLVVLGIVTSVQVFFMT